MRRILTFWVALLACTPSAWGQAVIVPSPVPTCSNGDVLQWNTAGSNFVCASVGAAAQPFDDSFGLIAHHSDATKVLKFDVSAIAGGTTRTWTIPDANLTVPSTLASLGTNTFTGLQTMNGGLAATTGTFSSTLAVTGATTLNAVAYTWPGAQGSAAQVLTNNGAGVLSWAAPTAALPNPIAADMLFTDATYDIGKSGATRPRDFFLSRNATISGTLNVTGILTLSSVDNAVGTITSGVWHGTAIGDTYLAALDASKLSGTITSAVQDNITRLGTVTSGVWNAGAVTSSGNITGPKLVPATGAGSAGVGMSFVSNYLTFNTGSNGLAVENNAHTANLAFLTNVGVMTIINLATGSLSSASGVITSSSDERLKDISGPLTYGLAEVLALRPIRYHWNKASGIPTEPEYGGFGAAQVEGSMPLAVSYGSDGMRALNTTVILGGVVVAIQEQETRLRAVEAKLGLSVPAPTPVSAAQIQQEIAARKAADQAVLAKRLAEKKEGIK